jgi:hypothetical protein
MRWIVIMLLTLLGCLAGSTAFAGRLFGDITVNGKPVPAGLRLRIALVLPASTLGAERAPVSVVADSTTTDKYGSYKLTVKQEGRCILTLVYEKQTPTLEVFAYRDATRYDLIVDQKDGTLSLRRK